MARGLADPMPASGRWGDLRIRVASAVVLVPLALGCVWVGHAAFWLLIGAAALGLAAEWVRLRRAAGGRAAGGRAAGGREAGRREAFGRSPAAGSRSGVQTGQGSPPVLSDRHERLPTVAHKGGTGLAEWPSVLITPAGFLYIALASASLLWLRADPLVGRANVLVLLLLVWASDVGAYAVGRSVGGVRLAPSISPGKTVSGAIGGLVAAVAVGVSAALALSQSPHLLRAGVLAAGLGVVAQAGDLFESWVKRRLGVKDSGSLIPGHGGLFDRLDALLAVAPAAALLALWAGRGVAWWE